MTAKESKAISTGDEAFLSRWSRLKQEANEQPQQKTVEPQSDPKSPQPELPPVDKLSFESDYRGFMHPKVSEDTRRAALRKLFSDPHFSAIDMMDVYIDDYSRSDPIPSEMLKQLRQAQKILDWASGKDDDAPERSAGQPSEVPENAAALEERRDGVPTEPVPQAGKGDSVDADPRSNDADARGSS